MTLKVTILLFLVLNISVVAIAQSDTVFLKKEAKHRIITDRPPQAFYAELGGPGPFYSANYDRRFNNRLDGWGFRAGIGYSFMEEFKVVSFPVGINYLVGDSRRGRYFEVGLNETVMMVGSSPYDNNSYNYFSDNNIPNNSTQFLTSVNLGYRSQPVKGGFNFRGGLLPLLFRGNAAMSIYISLGYNF